MTTRALELLLKDLVSFLPETRSSRHIAFEKFLSLFPTHFRKDPLPVFEKGSIIVDSKDLCALPPRDFNQEEDLWALLNWAFCENPTFLSLSARSALEKKLCYTSPRSSAFSLLSPSLHLHLEKGATGYFVIQEEEEGVNYFMNSLFEATLEEESRLTVVHFSPLGGRGISRHLFRAKLKANSQFHFFSLSCGPHLHHKKIEVELNGQGAEANLVGLTLLGESCSEKTSVQVMHNSPQSRSHQHCRVPLFQESSFDFKGHVHIKEEAKGAMASQISRALLLSNEAKATLEPFLEIDTDDVKASHGATVGRLDTDELFYCKARGIEERRAHYLLACGFIDEMLNLFPEPMARKRALQMIERVYGT